MKQNQEFDGLAEESANAVWSAFEDYNAEFLQITQRARKRFETRDWKGSQRDAVERIELYDLAVRRTVVELKRRLGFLFCDRILWMKIKDSYADRITKFVDLEFYKTFFNSITRQIFQTVGVDSDVEFVALDYEPITGFSGPVPTKSYINRKSAEVLFKNILTEYAFSVPFCDIDYDTAYIVNEANSFCAMRGLDPKIQRVELFSPEFHQITRVYIVGRIFGRDWESPFAIALKNTETGVVVDAVLMSEDELGILFSYTRSYFHVELKTVSDAVVFLMAIMPQKGPGQLFTVLGRARQGKTDRYRNLFQHLVNSNDSFVHAPGDKGLVMIVFALPSHGIVIKVIRDKFPYPKTVSRQEVMDRYRSVFEHDRAGRLADAQEFRYLKFPKDRFSPELLDELATSAAESVLFEGENLIFKHCYIERCLIPLNLYLLENKGSAARKAVYDYGQAIRDLALSNIFPGDLLLKNFGVTSRDRVIFYDYDELCMVTDCNFRDPPPATSLEDEMRSEAWFYVADNDVFPSQFISFLGFDDDLRDFFMKWHSEILTAEYWRNLQAKHRVGEVLDVVPYHRYPIQKINPLDAGTGAG